MSIRTLIVLALFPVVACDCAEPLAALPGALEGELCDDEGAPMGLVEVEFTAGGFNELTLTKEDGTFDLDGLPAGLGEITTGERVFPVQIVSGETAELEDANCDIVPPVVEPPVVETGDLTGRVCAPDGSTWLAGADVFIVTPETDYEAVTDAEGLFLLEDVPAGTHALLISKGSFNDTRAVTITANVLTELPEEECAIEVDLRLAMVAHSQYERVQDVILELGIDPALVDDYGSDWAAQLLTDFDTVSQYEILFLPCRAAEPEFMGNPVYAENLRRFVAEGGSLYTSDQGYDFVERLFPDKVDFHGDDNVLGAGDRGGIVNALQGEIVDPDLRAFMGTDQIDLHYALETWSVMESSAADVDVYVRADAPLIGGAIVEDAPQVIGFDHGEGRVIYSSFHQEPGVSVDQEVILRYLIFEL